MLGSVGAVVEDLERRAPASPLAVPGGNVIHTWRMVPGPSRSASTTRSPGSRRRDGAPLRPPSRRSSGAACAGRVLEGDRSRVERRVDDRWVEAGRCDGDRRTASAIAQADSSRPKARRYAATSRIGGRSRTSTGTVSISWSSVNRASCSTADAVGLEPGASQRGDEDRAAPAARARGAAGCGARAHRGRPARATSIPNADDDVDEQPELDAPPLDERHRVEHLAAAGVLAGERLDDLGEGREEMREQRPGDELGDAPASGLTVRACGRRSPSRIRRRAG